MSTVKNEAIHLIEKLPESSNWVDVTYKMYVRAKIEQGLADVQAGNVIPHEQVMLEMEEWLASLGQPSPSPISEGH